jgi:hypothetical protein
MRNGMEMEEVAGSIPARSTNFELQNSSARRCRIELVPQCPFSLETISHLPCEGTFRQVRA